LESGPTERVGEERGQKQRGLNSGHLDAGSWNVAVNDNMNLSRTIQSVKKRRLTDEGRGSGVETSLLDCPWLHFWQSDHPLHHRFRYRSLWRLSAREAIYHTPYPIKLSVEIMRGGPANHRQITKSGLPAYAYTPPSIPGPCRFFLSLPIHITTHSTVVKDAEVEAVQSFY
jgi:hypothetical protein